MWVVSSVLCEEFHPLCVIASELPKTPKVEPQSVILPLFVASTSRKSHDTRYRPNSTKISHKQLLQVTVCLLGSVLRVCNSVLKDLFMCSDSVLLSLLCGGEEAVFGVEEVCDIEGVAVEVEVVVVGPE